MSGTIKAGNLMPLEALLIRMVYEDYMDCYGVFMEHKEAHSDSVDRLIERAEGYLDRDTVCEVVEDVRIGYDCDA